MKVLLLKDIYKLGRAGDIKKVADGYGRNYLIPHGLATLATPGAIKRAENIRKVADEQRIILNAEMNWIAEKIAGASINFQSKAGETGKLYGSITTQMIADSLSKLAGTEIDRRLIDIQPIRTLGAHKVIVRLTVDLTPEVTVHVYREGELPKEPKPEIAAEAPSVEETVAPEQDADAEEDLASEVEEQE